MSKSCPMPIRRWIILFSGFLQDASQRHGSTLLWRELYARHAGPETVVEPHPWNTHVRTLALRIRNESNGQAPDVVIGGYSFGGMTAANLARELGYTGIPVRQMVLSDPVYRHGYYAGWWRSLMPWCEIEIPENVWEVKYFVQDNPRFWLGRDGGWIQPAGHRLVPQNKGATTIHEPIYLPHDHSSMDDSREYHQTMLAACEGEK